MKKRRELIYLLICSVSLAACDSSLQATPPASNTSASSMSAQVGVQLAGVVSDDGLPTLPGIVTSKWSIVSGPGPVQFENSSDPKTKAYFSQTGVYVLRLTANDGEKTSHDDVTIEVK